MKKIFYLIVVFGLFFTSCEKLVVTDPNEVVVVDSTDINVLGLGYDVMDNFADPYRVKGQILDIDKLKQSEMIRMFQIETSNFKTTEGRTISEYLSNFSSNTSVSGSYGGWSGSVRVNFKSSFYSNEDNAYATVASVIRKYMIQVAPQYLASNLKEYLDEDFKRVLNDESYSAIEVFKIYGTHCMSNIAIGGRLDFNVVAKKSTFSGSRSIGVYAEVAYNNFFGIGDGFEVSTENVASEEWENVSQSMDKSLQVYGGASEYGQGIINAGQYAGWIRSVSENMVLCDFGPENNSGLIPIWEFCDSDARKQELLDAFLNEWATERAIDIYAEYPHNCIVDLNIVAWDHDPMYLPQYYFENDLMYQRLEVDLNAGAGGDYVYLYYALGLDDGSESRQPITDVFVYSSVHMGFPGGSSGWEKIDVDLNSGAGGATLFLYFKRREGAPAIRGLAVKTANNAEAFFTQFVTDSTQFFKPVLVCESDVNLIVMQDLGQDAGGSFQTLHWTIDLFD